MLLDVSLPDGNGFEICKEIKEKNDIFIDNANLQGRMSVFHDKLRKHLSNEYLFLSEKKDNLENEILQLKLEKEQKILWIS